MIRSERMPSVKSLMKIPGMEPHRAKLLRHVLKCGARDQLADIADTFDRTFHRTNHWLHGCVNQPDVQSIKMKMADEIIDGCGVEYCGLVDLRDGPPLEYVNLGDTYYTTLCLFRGRFRVCSWGDIVEKHPRLFRE